MSNIGEDRLEHERIGIGARVDYKIDRTHRVFVNTMYSDYNDILDRRQLTLAPTAAQVRPGFTNTVTETINQTASPTQLTRARGSEAINVVAGGEKRLARGLVDYGFNFSYSTGTEDRVLPTVQALGVGFRFDRSQDTMYP